MFFIDVFFIDVCSCIFPLFSCIRLCFVSSDCSVKEAVVHTEDMSEGSVKWTKRRMLKVVHELLISELSGLSGVYASM